MRANKKPTRGGKREGAGRPATTGRTEPLSLRISKEGKANIEAKMKATDKSASALVDDWAKKLKTKKKP